MPTSISRIKLPNGSYVEIKDSVARQMLAGGINFVIAWDGNSAPDVTKIPEGVKVIYNETEYTGTMAAASGAALTFYLVKSATQKGANDIYDEYVVVKLGEGTELDPFVFSWEKLGDTRLDLSDLGALAWKDSVSLNKGNGDQVLGADTTFTNGSSSVSFAEGAGSDFVTGYNNDAVAPSFSEGAFTPASLSEGFVVNGSAPSFSEGAFTPASIGAGFVTNGTAPSFSEGAFTPAAIQEGFVSAGTAPSFSEGAFSAGTLPSLGASSKSAFATEGMVASMGTGDDAETLILTAASTSNAVTEQGTFDAGSLPSKAADSFSAGTTPSVIDTSKFSGGSKAADTFSAGSMTQVDVTKFNGGSKAADTFSAGSMTQVDVTKFNGGSKAADSFSAGSAATLAKAKALTAAVTGTAAAQTITVGSNDNVKIAAYDDLSVSVQ